MSLRVPVLICIAMLAVSCGSETDVTEGAEGTTQEKVVETLTDQDHEVAANPVIDEPVITPEDSTVSTSQENLENIATFDEKVDDLVEVTDTFPAKELSVPSEVDQVDSKSSLLLIALIVLSATALVSIAISFWLYRWRRVLLGNLKALAPEEFAAYVKSLNGSVGEYAEVVVRGVNKVSQDVNQLQSITENMVNTFMSLQDSIDKKDQEIARYKSGYDTKIFKQYINRFLRVDGVIDDLLIDASDELQQALREIQVVLEDALDDCGVEKFSPEIGGQYTNTEGVADRPKQEETDDPEKHGLISQVIDSGYRLRANGGAEIIVPAKVVIFTFTK